MKTNNDIKRPSTIQGSKEEMRNPLGYSNHPLGEDYYSFKLEDIEINPYDISKTNISIETNQKK